ncbi:MAG: hypothetical protein WC539_07450 [Nitrospirota bacterium]
MKGKKTKNGDDNPWIDAKFTKISQAANKYLGLVGRMTYRSKSMGTPESMFNINVFNSKAKKIWFGDLELARWHDRVGLIRLSEEEGPIYVLYERDGRFRDKMPTLKYVKAVAAITVQNGVITYSEEQKTRIKGLEERIRRQTSEDKTRDEANNLMSLHGRT